MNTFCAILITLVAIAWLKAIYDLVKSKILSPAEKIILGVIVFILPILGIGIFYRFEQNKRFSLRNKNTGKVF